MDEHHGLGNAGARQRYASFLTPRQREALEEWDNRPPEFTPRRQITPAGAALLYRPDLDDMAEREAREAREAERRAARELRERQRQHPLYNTHHREQLLRTWKEHGEPPMPPKALHGFTEWIMRHADALEDDVRRHAEALTKSTDKTILERLGKYADGFYREKNPTEITQRNMRRALRAAFRQFNEMAAHILHLVGHHGQRYVSNENLKTRRNQMHKQQLWIQATKVDGPHLKKPIALEKCIRTFEARAAELYSLSKGLETYMTEKGRVALFVTITAPARFHPNPFMGQRSWDGSSVTDSHVWFTQRWARVRTDIKNRDIRMDGMRVTEPHRDGSEHWHILIYARPDNITTIKAAITRRFMHSPNAIRFEQVSCTNTDGKKASPASYMQKYILKAITTIPTSTTTGTETGTEEHDTSGAEAADAWRSTWGIRGFQFFGVLYGKQTLWREMRRMEKQPDEPSARRLWRAARGTRAHDFIAALDDDRPEVATIREQVTTWAPPNPTTGEIEPDGYKAGRILGIVVNGQRYMTRPATPCNIITDYTAMQDPYFVSKNNDYTVIHSCPSASLRSPSSCKKPPPRPRGFGQRAA